MTTAPIPVVPRTGAWRGAVFAVLLLNGFAIATVLARMPALRDHLGVDPGGIGLLLAFFSGGTLVGLAFSGALVHAIGVRRVIQIGIPVLSVAIAALGLMAAWLGDFTTTALAAAIFGMGVAVVDVAANVEGAAIERATGRTVLTFLHGGFSIGTVIGAAGGALAAQLGVDVVVQFSAAGVIGLVVALVAPRWIPDVAEDAPPKPSLAERRAVWKQPRTILLGLVVFAFAYIEGAATDWLPLALVDERGMDQAQGALMLAAFTAMMAVGRFAGTPLITRYGRLPMLLGSAVIAAVGAAIFLFVAEPWAVVAGVLVWALGSSLGFPIGLSAAGDDPSSAATRVAAVSLIGYAAFFAGPPLVGLVADSTGILTALSIVFVLIAIALLASPAVRPQSRPQSR